MNLSFCGCGFLAAYHLGVAKALLQHGSGFLSRVQKVSGASAGALAGALLVVKPEAMERGRTFLFDLAANVRKKPAGAFTPNYNLLKPLEDFLRSEMPIDGHVRASGRLYLSLTNPKKVKNKVMSEYHSNEELLKHSVCRILVCAASEDYTASLGVSLRLLCMIASCYIPVYAGLQPPVIRGQMYIDGGITDNLYIFEEGRTITVSPFSGPQDISPKDPTSKLKHINMKNQDFQISSLNLVRYKHALFPPSDDQLSQYHDNGFQDCLQFLKREEFFECAKQAL